MRINAWMAGAVVPGLVAGVIYLVIAFATGGSAAASVFGGVVVAVFAVGIGVVFRAVYHRRAASPPDSPEPRQ